MIKGNDTQFSGSVGIGILWDSHRLFCRYGMGMEIEIQSPSHTTSRLMWVLFDIAYFLLCRP